MSLRINQNISALSAHRWLQTNDASMAKSIERLSSGFRINSAADDAAGLVVSETLRTQISGLGVASRNTQDAINVVKTTEKALDEVESQLRNIRDLSLSAANANGNSSVIAANQAQVDKALEAIDRMADQTEFAGLKLLSDSTGTNSIEGKVFQIGANVGQTAAIAIRNMAAGSLGKNLPGNMFGSLSTIDVTTVQGAQDAQSIIDAAINEVSTTRGTLGSFQKNTLESNLRNLRIAAQNLTASESQIRDTDMAEEMSEFTKNQILVQAGTAMLAQANQMPQVVLSLFQ